MKKVWRYWRYVATVALRATGRDIKGRILRFLFILIGAGLAGYYLHVKFGADRLWIAGLAALYPVSIFLLKFVTVPADLHEFQLTRKEIKRSASALDALWERGRGLYGDASLAGISPDDWNDAFGSWQHDVLNRLAGSNKGERFMFDSIGYKLKLQAQQAQEFSNDSTKAHEYNVSRLIDQMNKLRFIVSRAYARAKGSQAEAYVEEE